MKILHILYESHGDYFGVGGVATRAYEIYRYLMQRHDITLLCKKYPGARDEEINGLRHIFVGTESRSLTKTFLSYAYQSAQFVRKHGNDYDIIIEEFSPAIPTFLHAFTKRPVVLQVQGYTGFYYFKKYNPAYALILFLLERIMPLFYRNFIFINSPTVKRVFPLHLRRDTPHESHLSLQEGEVIMRRLVSIIPNGISPDLLDVLPEDGDYILYLGRIDIYSKGLDILIEAYREFYRSYPDIRLVIAGDGRDRQKFETMLMRIPAEVRRNIELTGWITGDRKIETIRKALFCIFPSRHEAHPISVLEAMACGKAVVVSDIPEFRYIVMKGAGDSFKSGDFRSLALIMKELTECNEREDKGNKGRRLAGGLTWQRIAMEFEDFLYRVMERGKGDKV
ncbi:MAG: hypothetical protein Fur0020_13760 [Thermodesulfovibrionia bacterium]